MDTAVREYAVEITTLDGQTLNVGCAPHQTVLEAARQAQWQLPAQCRQGSCGACHAQVLSGACVLGAHSPSALPVRQGGRPSDGQGGECGVGQDILLCCTTPSSDLRVALPCDSARIGRGEIPCREAEVLALVPDGPSTTRLVLRLLPDADGVAVAEFEPGQFVELEVPGQSLKRAYSLANTGNWDGQLELLIRHQPQGRFSGWLAQEAQVGARLVVHGPQGAFGLRENGLRARWFVAGGTGLAPLLSMMRRMVEFQEPHEMRLFLGVTHEHELLAQAALDELQAQRPDLVITRCVWQAQATWAGFHGSAVETMRQALSGVDSAPDIYLCGPPAMVDAALAAALAQGVPAEQVISERFSSA